jgi:hypothetical protein
VTFLRRFWSANATGKPFVLPSSRDETFSSCRCGDGIENALSTWCDGHGF